MSKKLCLDCKKSFQMSSQDANLSNLKCPEWGKYTITITHRFRPPKIDNDRKWDVVKFLVKNGFQYQHISIFEHDRHGIQRFIAYAKYPENMSDAIEFIDKFKEQAIKTKIVVI